MISPIAANSKYLYNLQQFLSENSEKCPLHFPHSQKFSLIGQIKAGNTVIYLLLFIHFIVSLNFSNNINDSNGCSLHVLFAQSPSFEPPVMTTICPADVIMSEALQGIKVAVADL